jgi:hypothetical protein
MGWECGLRQIEGNEDANAGQSKQCAAEGFQAKKLSSYQSKSAITSSNLQMIGNAKFHARGTALYHSSA